MCDDPKCKGKLKDTIINFGQDLPEGKSYCRLLVNENRWLILTASSTDVLDASFEHAQKADLCLAMGSSLTVTPAADIPEVRFSAPLFLFQH